MERFWDFFVRKRNFSILVVIALIVLGFYSFVIIPKESAPEVRVPVALVTTVYPGASALDMEVLVTNEIEDRLVSSIGNIDSITSTSLDGVSTVVVQFDASADIEESVREVSDQVETVRPELPSGAEDPVVSEINFVDQPIMTVSVASDLPLPELITLAEEIEDELEVVTGVARVETTGIPGRQISVVVDERALVAYDLSISQVVQAISLSNATLPVGSIVVDGISYRVSFEGELSSAEDIELVSIQTVNGPILVRDIADVIVGVDEQNTFSRISVAGEPSRQAVSFNVYKQGGGDITDIASRLREKVDFLEETSLQDSTVLISFDVGEFVEKDLTNLGFTGLQTVILVFLVLLMALGWREALVAGIAIPLSFLLSFIGLEASGNTINFVSLFSLILAVGILVDSAIVVTEAIHTKLQEGMTTIEASLATIHEFHWPLLSGTATTIAVFTPLFFLSGITGEFIASIPFTILFVLTASLFVALAIVPLIASKILAVKSRETKFSVKLREKQEFYTIKLQSWYETRLVRFLEDPSLQKKFLRGLVIAFFVALVFPVIGLVRVEFFPQEDIDFLYVEIEEPTGTVLERTDIAVRGVEEVLYEEEEIDSFITTVGSGSAFGSGGSGENLANITIILDSNRSDSSSLILARLREQLDQLQNGDIRISQPNNGPPVGDPVVVNIYGDDFASLEEATLVVERIVGEVEGVVDITSSSDATVTEFSIAIDRLRAAQYGVDPLTVAQILRTSIFGSTATELQVEEGDIEVDVLLDLNPSSLDPSRENITTTDRIEQIQLQTPSGAIPLSAVATVNLERSRVSIAHDDRSRVASVSSGIAPGASLPQVLQEIQKGIDSAEFPQDVRISIGGETEEQEQAFREMGIALLGGLLLIIAVLVLQFNSYRQTFIIILIVPLSLIGVLVGLALFGKALSFPSIMGFIALSGIVVNNSIILIDVMNSIQEKSPERPVSEVAKEGAVLRLRPILLTTLTTVIGLIPLTYASELWAPLAYAIIFGLSFAVVITLLLVPILYVRRSTPGEKRSWRKIFTRFRRN